ncbi:hypothetical protein AGMMS50293_02780 [Spirochaetia bacterium]|nr:hypothetical protein AGMMS50293_02780 [Spirochaetia bacterium]
MAVSRNCKQELEDLYGITSKKIIVLNNFVDERLFYPEAVSQSKKIRVLFSGRLEERKGLSKLVELAKAVELTENYELRIATNSQDNAEQCKGLKNTLININLDIQAMHDFYNAGDIFFFPTKYEGFSMATLEALASGIPVIGTGFAIPEELRHYDFVQIVESQRTEELLEKAAIMVDTFKNRRLEIHNTIIKDFGSGQYKVKLFSLLQI